MIGGLFLQQPLEGCAGLLRLTITHQQQRLHKFVIVAGTHAIILAPRISSAGTVCALALYLHQTYFAREVVTVCFS